MRKYVSLFVIIIVILLSTRIFAQPPVTSGLVIHLDADTITGISDGSSISSWNDAQQTISSRQPTYIQHSSAFNNNSSILFDGDDDFLTLPNPAPFNVGSVTMFAVARYNYIGSDDQYIVAGQDGGGNDRIRFAITDSGFEYRIGSSGWKAINSGPGTADQDVHIFEIDSNAIGFLDGVSVNTASNSSTETPIALTVGSYNLGQKDFFNGELAELIIYNRVMDDTERNLVGAYLEEKYALDTDYGMPPVTAYSPSPANESMNMSLSTVLSFQVPSELPDPKFNIYFSESPDDLALIAQQYSSTSFDPSEYTLLEAGKKYYWRVDVVGQEPGPVWSFSTVAASSMSLSADMNEDGIVDMYDLQSLVQSWLSESDLSANIDKQGRVDMKDYACLSSMWKKNGPFPAGYVVSRFTPGSFKVAHANKVASIYVSSDDYSVCRIAADCLAKDIEAVCGIEPEIVHDISGLTGDVIIIGTLGASNVIDSLAADSKIDISDITGQWETFALEVIENPVGEIDNALVIVGSDRRGTAYGVFDLSEKMGVSPWFWWADVPIRFRDSIIVRDGRYKQGPPSVKYRGIFINDEDWGLHPWAKNTYSPEDGYIGPKVYEKVFELLLRLKANHIWPAMHNCTKAFNAFEENKFIADDYGIVMGSSHCEQMLRNNVWEWSRWDPATGSQGSWDWCTNSSQIQEYWQERVEANAEFENVYSTGMRGVHDGSMPCSGASSYQKVQKMEDEVFPAQQQLIANWVDQDYASVPQVFCPYKEVLDLYDLDMQVPEYMTLLWPDDNHGYIRRLSNSSEQTRSGRSGVYYHMSYWGSPHDYLWLCSTGPGLIWEEMKKAYDYGADRVWVFNVGDIKPAEISMEFGLRLAWNINCWDNTNLRDYLEYWAWREFGPDHKTDIANILVEYYRLGLTRKPEHLTSSGEGFSFVDYNDEAQSRIDAYKSLEDKAASIYQSLSGIYKDSFFQLVLYPVRGASLMNQKILYAQKSIAYSSQNRVSANDYAQMAQSAYDQIKSETSYYNDVISGGKWKDMMSYNPRGLAVFNMPATGSVQPVSGASMGVAIEGQHQDIAGSVESGIAFYDDFSSGSADNWQLLQANRWVVDSYGSYMELAINTTDYTNLSGDRLGEMALIENQSYDNFTFSCLCRSRDNFSSNSSADLAIIFGYVDQYNYNYIILSNKSSNSALFRIQNGTRSLVESLNIGIPDNNFYPLEIDKSASGLTIKYRGQTVFASSQQFDRGMIGVGSYNDSAAFTNVDITPLQGVSGNYLPGFDVFTKGKHYIDIFNKGDSPFSWTAVPSQPWITLDTSSGTIASEQRIWVSIDWTSAPIGQANAKVDISGAGRTVSVDITAFNPASPRPEDISGFVSSNGCVSMEAENYSDIFAKDNVSWSRISTLGCSGDTMTILPTTAPSITELSDIIANSPSLVYDMYLWDTGSTDITVLCLPTHAATTERGLRYAIAIDGNQPQIIEFDTAEWSSQWSLNVLQGAAITKSTHNIAEPGEHKLTIWMVDPGVVLDKIIVGDYKSSRLGPPETSVKLN